jgi:hypothetical protein
MIQAQIINGLEYGNNTSDHYISGQQAGQRPLERLPAAINFGGAATFG